MPTDIELEKHYRESAYVLETIDNFERSPGNTLKDIRGVLVLMIALSNGSRTGEFSNLRVRNLHKL
ncbi:hypothetical protein DPMN_018688 [Dreissena polymorpha]|uniref:Uncharacterized protein n=1 Tax=Dreissena polymorpha TaxID=45954 RepID=A0A9D4NFL7_DREPO|nr:hypothetical protein DPMN_018688 [Dreissena polymorpha]